MKKKYCIYKVHTKHFGSVLFRAESQATAKMIALRLGATGTVIVIS